jgi:hypothetical protein
MKLINYDEFIRSFAVRPNKAMSFFLGSGSSIQAGIPTGGAMTWEFKRKLYCSINKTKEEKFKDLESERNRKIIQDFFDRQVGYPPLYSSEEYSFYFEKCYPSSIDRKCYIQTKVSNIFPSIGHKCLGALIKEEKIDHIWTTNFDELIENGLKSIDTSISFEVISPENANLIDSLGSQYPKIIKLHGDYRYDKLQNTLKETQELNQKLHTDFKFKCKDRGLIIIGYSGNDQSIMSLFVDSLNNNDNPFPYGLIWCIRKGEKPSEILVKLLEEADSKNGNSGFVEIDNFDEFLFEVYSFCNYKNAEIENIASILFQKRRPYKALQAKQKSDLIKLNGFQALEFPKSIYTFDTTIQTWKELRESIKDKNIIAAFYKGKTFAFGDLAEINITFSDKLRSEINITDIEERWLYNFESFYFGMLYDLIDRSLLNNYSLKKVDQGHRCHEFYTEEFIINSNIIPSYYKAYEAFEYQLSFYSKNLWMIILPSIHISDLRGQYSRFEQQRIVNSIISNKRNKDVNDQLDCWRKWLFQKSNGNMTFQLNSFCVKLSTVYAYSGSPTTDKTFFFEGVFTNEEPSMVFNVNDDTYKTVHPLKGLKNFNPLDLSYENKELLKKPVIRLAIISPTEGYTKLINHLNELKSNLSPKSEKEYLIDYTGFDSIYNRFIEIPNNQDSKYCVYINKDEYEQKTYIEFYETIKRKIDYFDTLKGEFDVLIIYFSQQWSRYREFKNDDIYFDLHDSIKIYCAKKNIKIQFIEDKSINYFDQCKVKWWLSLGLYVKANGTPWKMERVDNNVAYIGLGYAIRGSLKNKVVMGCSQIYDSSGQGLRFLLQPIDKPIFYGKNPFMSKEDARRLILKLKEAYYQMDPNSRLEKLVIHKTTHFTKEEIEGISQALDGIPNIELLQIQQFNYWRGIRGNSKGLDNFPVLRGTTIQLDDYSFLLWTHGSVINSEIYGTYNYYQGKRGIPAPLLIKRFRGQDTIETTSKEILNLTKMNWNGGQLYKILPVTLDFSKMLSKMAKQSEALGNIPYDFRFFM